MEYLGHRVSPKGVEMVPDYVQRVQEWRVPSSSKDVATFLGFCGYYCSFIRLYSALTNRMNSMRKTDKFLWTIDMQQDFEALKPEFQIGRVQAYPDFCSGEPFRVTTNWSKNNIAGILSQTRKEKKSSLAAGAGNATNMSGTIPATKENDWQ